MAEWTTLHSSRGTLQAWHAPATATPRGGLVVIQEIFGVNPHIRDVAGRYAAEGYEVLAPALFDLAEPGVELAYEADDFQRGRELAAAVGLDGALAAVAAAADWLRGRLGADARIGTVGYCWGGTLVLRAAQVLGLPGASYYGARDVPFLDAPLQAPVIFHFGEQDPSIPAEAVQAHREKLPGTPVYTYPSGHAFNRDVDPKAYHAESAALALSRTLAFLRHNVG